MNPNYDGIEPLLVLPDAANVHIESHGVVLGGYLFHPLEPDLPAPVLLIHGDQDTRVPTEQSLMMKDALLRAGKPVELKFISGATHSFGPAGVKMAWAWTLEFFDQHLKIRNGR